MKVPCEVTAYKIVTSIDKDKITWKVCLVIYFRSCSLYSKSEKQTDCLCDVDFQTKIAIFWTDRIRNGDVLKRLNTLQVETIYLLENVLAAPKLLKRALFIKDTQKK